MLEIKACGNGIIRTHPKSQIRLFNEEEGIIRSLLMSMKPCYYVPGKGDVNAIVLQAVKANEHNWLIEFMNQEDYEEAIKE